MTPQEAMGGLYDELVLAVTARAEGLAAEVLAKIGEEMMPAEREGFALAVPVSIAATVEALHARGLLDEAALAARVSGRG